MGEEDGMGICIPLSGMLGHGIVFCGVGIHFLNSFLTFAHRVLT